MDIGRTYSLLWGLLSQWHYGRLENRMCAGLYQHAESYTSLKDVALLHGLGCAFRTIPSWKLLFGPFPGMESQ